MTQTVSVHHVAHSSISILVVEVTDGFRFQKRVERRELVALRAMIDQALKEIDTEIDGVE